MKKLLEYTEILKHLPRTGWCRFKIKSPETVASHSWQMAMMAMQLAGALKKEAYDFNKVIKMCLCHDMGESIIGDITPVDEEYKEKAKKEQKAIKCIAKTGNIPEIIELYKEYEKNETPEAMLANDLDKLDMYAQSLDYEKKYPHKDLSEFRQSAINRIKTKLGKKILEEIAKQ